MKEYRKYITSAVGFTFLVVGGTGVFFKFFFKNKPMEEIHTWVGIMMVIGAVLHIVQNWKPLTNHFKEKKVFLLLIPILAVVSVFTVFDKNGNKGINPREIMRLMADSKLNTVAEVFKKNPNDVIEKMKSGGVTVVDPNMTLVEIAKSNHRTPPEMLIYFK